MLTARICEFGGIANQEPDCRNADWKNEKGWPPIHSCEQSLQIISMRGD
jgi:hypothetical protein